MDAGAHEAAVAAMAAAVGEPARARMLFALLDGHARTATELAAVAEVGAPTASTHLHLLLRRGLVSVAAAGRHRYYRLAGRNVAEALERLSALAGGPARPFVPSTPEGLHRARTCYDHLAGRLGVGLHDRLQALGWVSAAYVLMPAGEAGLRRLQAQVASGRRRFAYACLDWSERRPHLGGALGAALLELALRRRWVRRELDTRALEITARGRCELKAVFGLVV